jgi:hypothetical protein
MKQETLYEAFLNCLINKEFKTKEDYIAFKGAEFGAKWQQERSYNEEEVKRAFKVGFSIGYGSPVNGLDSKDETCEVWFEQLKNK